jgi:hypothetical protein
MNLDEGKDEMTFTNEHEQPLSPEHTCAERGKLLTPDKDEDLCKCGHEFVNHYNMRRECGYVHRWFEALANQHCPCDCFRLAASGDREAPDGR